MKYFLLTAITFLVPLSSVFSQTQPFILDGQFEDWPNAFSWKDASGDGPMVDFIEMGIANDAEYLFLRIKVAAEIELNNNNKIAIYIDGDNNTLTGTAFNGIGAELRINPGDRNAVIYNGGFNTQVSLNAIRYRSLPSVSGTEFEIALRRDLKPDGKNSLFQGSTIRLALKDHSSSSGDVLPDSGSFLTFTFDSLPVMQFKAVNIDKLDASLIRIMTYNVLSDGLDDIKRSDQFKRIIRAMKPDIITFNECWNTKPSVIATFLNGVLPLPNFQNWNTVKIDAGNITASRYPVIQNWEVSQGSRQTASLIDLPASFASDILIINAHFRCCTDDTGRQLESDAFVNFILDAKMPGGKLSLSNFTPFVLSGDLNFVGKQQQLKTVLSGQIVNSGTYGPGGAMDWDGTPLEDAVALHTDQPMAYTWRDEGIEFPPARIDYQIYSGSVMSVNKSFVLDTETMPLEKLALYGLERNDTKIASDHLPIVTDFKLTSISTATQETIPGTLLVYPNPFAELIYLDFSGFRADSMTISIMDMTGRVMLKSTFESGQESFKASFETLTLKPGIYIVEIRSGEETFRQKIVKH